MAGASSVAVVVVAAARRPPCLAPARAGSAILMTWPGRHELPSSPVLKLTTSDCSRSVNSSQRPTRFACPREVQPNAATLGRHNAVARDSVAVFDVFNFLPVHIGRVVPRHHGDGVARLSELP